ncbi:MAG: integrase family protein [Pseudomonadota bacterium]
MNTQKLTKRNVDNAEPREAPYTLFDSQLSGFGLRVYLSGKKSWILEYRPGDDWRRTAKKRITIGRVGELTPDMARKAAERLLARIRIGEDPQAEKAARRQTLTVSELAEAFMEGHVRAKRKPGTVLHYNDILDRIVLPDIGAMKAETVTRARVAKLHLKWKHTPYQSNRMVSVVASMYGYAEKHGLVPQGSNPARGIEKFKEAGRERYLTVDELERLGAAIREADTDGIPWDIDPATASKHVPKKNQEIFVGEHAAAALRLLIFTGARLREILHLRWTEVDLERGLLLLPDSRPGGSQSSSTRQPCQSLPT